MTTNAAMLQPVAMCVLALLSWLGYATLRWCNKHRVLSSLPSPRVKSWLGGHLAFLATTRHHRTVLRWANELGGLFVVRGLFTHSVVVSDPALVHSILKGRTDAIRSPVNYNVSFLLLRAPALFNASTSSPYWRAVRKGVAPAFTMRAMRAGFHHVQSTAAELVALLKEIGPDKVFDIDNLASRQSMDVIARIGFDMDFGSMKYWADRYRASGGKVLTGFDDGPTADDDLLRTLHISLEEMNNHWANPLRAAIKYLPGPLGAGVRANVRHWKLFMGRMARLLEAMRERGPPEDDDLSVAAHLLRLEDPVLGGPMSDARLVPEVATVFIAGTDTTGHSMTWAMYLVSQHPEVEARLCAELEGLSLLATPDNPRPRQVTFDDLSKMPYLTAVTKESLRMFPAVAGGTVVEFPHDIELRGHTIPAHTAIWTQLLCVQNSTRYWDEPERFDPDRFLKPGVEYWPLVDAASAPAGEEEEEENCGARVRRFIPFNIGARDCAGQSLAKVNYTATLATLWGNFSFRLAGESAGPGGVMDVVNFTLHPSGGVHMSAIPRAHLP